MVHWGRPRTLVVSQLVVLWSHQLEHQGSFWHGCRQKNKKHLAGMIGFRLWWYVHLCWKSCKVCFILHNICPHWTKTVFSFLDYLQLHGCFETSLSVVQRWWIHKKDTFVIGFWSCTQHHYTIRQNPGSAWGKIVYFDIQSHERWVVFFRLKCLKCFLAFWMSFKGRLVVFFTVLLSISELNSYCQCVNAAQLKHSKKMCPSPY